MISRLTIDVDLTKEVNGLILEESNLSVVKTPKIYIPSYMTYLNVTAESEPQITISTALNKNIYKNDVNPPKVTSNILREQNYITGCIYGTSEVKDMQTTVDIANNIIADVTKTTVRKRTVSYIVPKGTSVRCKFLMVN